MLELGRQDKEAELVRPDRIGRAGEAGKGG